MVSTASKISAARAAMCLAATLCALGCAALFAGPAAASSTAIYLDCNSDGVINGNYSKSDLQGALDGLPADLKQYSDCESAIQQALAQPGGKHGGGGGGGGNGGGNPLTTASKAARKRIAREVRKAAAAPTAGAIKAPEGIAFKPAGGQTLASSTAPAAPGALVVAIIGLIALIGAEIAGGAFKRAAARRGGGRRD